MIKKWIIQYYRTRCYLSIDDLPVYYWNKIKTENNLAYLERSGSIHIYRKKIGKIKSIVLKKIWKEIMDEYIERFGFAEAHLELMRKQRELIGYLVRRITEDNKSMNSYIRECEKEIEEIKEQMGEHSGDFFDLKAYIETSLRIQISLMNTSVAEFYSYLRRISKQGKKQVAELGDEL